MEIAGEDYREGMTAVVSVKVPEPQFKGQTKGELGNSEITAIVSQIAGDHLAIFLEENPKISKIIIDKIILAATARNAARKARELVQRKTYLRAEDCLVNSLIAAPGMLQYQNYILLRVILPVVPQSRKRQGFSGNTAFEGQNIEC